MIDLRKQIRATMFLGAAALLSGLIAHPALTDISHGEADLTLEWTILRLCAALLLSFVGAALWALDRALKVIR